MRFDQSECVICRVINALGKSQLRPQGLLAFQYGGGRREDPGAQRTKRSLIGAFHNAFIRALSLVYSFQNKDGGPLRASWTVIK